MPRQPTLEQRMTALENAVSELQRRLASGSVPPDWLSQVTGSITDEAAFREALQYGREFRQADRPLDEAEA